MGLSVPRRGVLGLQLRRRVAECLKLATVSSLAVMLACATTMVLLLHVIMLVLSVLPKQVLPQIKRVVTECVHGLLGLKHVKVPGRLLHVLMVIVRKMVVRLIKTPVVILTLQMVLTIVMWM